MSDRSLAKGTGWSMVLHSDGYGPEELHDTNRIFVKFSKVVLIFGIAWLR